MDAQKKIFIASLLEFLASAKEDAQKKRLKSAITMYFKAIVESCDFLIYAQILKVPKNHTDRFSLLKRYFPEIHPKVSFLFAIYRKTYSPFVTEKDLVEVRHGTDYIIKHTEISKYL